MGYGKMCEKTYDGGYVIVGETTQFPWLFFPSRLNLWLIKTDEKGNSDEIKLILP